jgi:Holliday junction resolvase
MASPSKAKGNRAERKLVDFLQSHGLVDTKRAWGSNGNAIGCHEEVDVLSNGCKIQVKARRELPAIVRDALTEHVDAAILYADRQPPVVVIKMDQFLHLLHENVYRT